MKEKSISKLIGLENLLEEAVSNLETLGIQYYKDNKYEDAFECLVYVEKYGNIEVKKKLASCYYSALGTEQNYNKAIELYKELVKEGVSEANYWLGICYYAIGEYCLMINCYKIAANLGYIDAQLALAHYLFKNENYEEAIEQFTKAAESGNEKAQLILGLVYSCKEIGNKDYAKSLFWYNKAATQGNAISQYHMGKFHYENGNYREAARYYSDAANQGYKQAQHELAYMYRQGGGVEENSEKAIELLRRALN